MYTCLVKHAIEDRYLQMGKIVYHYMVKWPSNHDRGFDADTIELLILKINTFSRIMTIMLLLIEFQTDF